MTNFDDIRPYYDSEVPQVLSRLVHDRELLDLLLSRQFPWLPVPLSRPLFALFRPLLSLNLRKRASRIKTVSDLQEHMSDRLLQVLQRTTDSYDFSGLENLQGDKPYLFMSNHRDIALDPAIICLGLTMAGRNTVRIAIGDNLLSKPFASDLMRINRSFIVKRSITGRRDKLAALKHLSHYIRHSIVEEDVSIWIAQAEGRAKDGYDRTETALLKMLALSKSKQQSFAEAIAQLNIVPVSLAYEYDPCDSNKADELHQLNIGKSYTKDPFEDLDSIKQGFVGYKGRINVTFGAPISAQFENADALAAEIDRQILQNYQLFPSNIIAWQLHNKDADIEVLKQLKSQWPDENWTIAEQKFKTRISAMPQDHRAVALAAYAAPVESQLAVAVNL